MTMRLRGSIVLFTVAAVAACSGSSSSSNNGGGGSDAGGSDGSGSSSGGSSDGGGDGAGSDPWVGTWACTGTASNTFTEPASAQPNMQPFANTTVIVDNGDGTITSTGTPPDGGDTCALKYTVSGNTETLVSGGQSCMNNNGTTEVYTSGTATLTGNTFMGTRDYTFSGTVTAETDAGPKQVMVAGSGNISATCTRQ
jgi:hypothetical protein